MQIGVKSTALRFGDNCTKPILAGFSIASLSLLSVAGAMNGQGLAFHLATWIGAGGHLAWQLKTVSLQSREDCMRKFKSNTWVGASVALGVLADMMITGGGF
jgi:4-hydroxybenzoate polyprenyltransferase